MRLLNVEEFFKSVADFEHDMPQPHTLSAFLERTDPFRMWMLWATKTTRLC